MNVFNRMKHAQLILPRDRMYPSMEFVYKSQAPYWFRTKMDALDSQYKITFKDFNIQATHGDIELAVSTLFLPFRS
jgi:hypothetical protein